jgi:hypothetical protein
MKLVNTIGHQKAACLWGNIKSHIAKLPPTNNKRDFVLKLQNKYTMINYSKDDLPENLKEIFDYFPEDVDLKFTIFKNNEILSEGFIKEYKPDVSIADNPNKPQLESKPDSFQRTVSSIKPNPVNDNHVPSNSNQVVDLDKLMRTFSDIQGRKLNDQFISLRNYLNEKIAQSIKPAPVPIKVEKYTDEFVDKLQKKNQELEEELKKTKMELKKSNDASLSLQIENVKLSTQLEFLSKDTSQDAKLKPVVSESKNLSIVEEEIDEAHKVELRKLNLEIFKKQLEVKNLKVKNESDVDRGMDFLAS